eukprot:1160055-Pelagomonas_calceolata.AAC.3
MPGGPSAGPVEGACSKNKGDFLDVAYTRRCCFVLWGQRNWMPGSPSAGPAEEASNRNKGDFLDGAYTQGCCSVSFGGRGIACLAVPLLDLQRKQATGTEDTKMGTPSISWRKTLLVVLTSKSASLHAEHACCSVLC